MKPDLSARFRARAALDRPVPDEPGACFRGPSRYGKWTGFYVVPDWLRFALGRGDVVESRHIREEHRFVFPDRPELFVPVGWASEHPVIRLSKDKNWMRLEPLIEPTEDLKAWLLI